MSDTSAALRDGLYDPPVLYWLTRASYALFGDGHFSTRLPEIAAFTLFCVLMYASVAPRFGHSYGIVAMLLPLVTRAFEYAYEARPYAVVLAFSGLAIVSWQRVEGRRRQLWRAMLFFALAGATLTHCYAILLVPAFQLSEAVRAWTRRRFDWLTTAAISAPSVVVFMYVPLLQNSNAVAVNNPVFTPTWAVVILAPRYFFAPAVWPLLLGLIGALLASKGHTEDSIDDWGLTTSELALAITLLALPILGTALAMTVTRIYLVRYGLPAIIGMSLLYIHVVHNRTGGRRLPPLVLAWVIGIWFFFDMADFMSRHSQSAAAAGVPEMITEAVQGQPELAIVAVNGLDFLPLDHYGSRELTQRLVFVYDQAAAVKYTGTDMFDTGLVRVSKWFPIRSRMEPYAAFIGAHRRFLMYGLTDFQMCWLHKKLKDDGAAFRLIDREGATLLLEVTMPERAAGLRLSPSRFSQSMPSPGVTHGGGFARVLQ